MKQRNPAVLLLALAMAFFLAACADILPQNFQESLIATETGATTARQAGAQAALAGKLSKADAQHVQDSADAIVAGVKAARTLPPGAAQNKYQVASDALTALQAFLVQRGVDPKQPGAKP